MKLIIATRNKHKVKEIKHLLKDNNLSILSLADLDKPPDIIEDGSTFRENAIKKTHIIARTYGLPVIADDSGIEVEYLNGEPGIYSARFAGENASDDDNNKKLLGLLEGVPYEKRRARYVCVIALSRNGFETLIFTGTCTGYIGIKEIGHGGFGYDPLFFFPPFRKTFAQLPLKKKNTVSHRAQSLKKLKRFLDQNPDYLL